MKKITLFFTLLLIAGFALPSFAQQNASATANSEATIITPITISKDRDLNFGSASVNATLGTIVITAVDATVRSATGGVRLITSSNPPASAKFTVGGQSGATFDITSPTTVTLTDPASNTMSYDVDRSPSGSTGTVPQIYYIGGTLHVAASQTAGVYSNAADLTLTVNYN